MSKITSIRLNDDIVADLDRLSVALDRPKSWLIEQAITDYVAEQAWQVQAISEALEAYQRGEEKLTPHDEVMDRIEARIRARH